MEAWTDFAALLGVETACAVRSFGEGHDKHFSLIDVAALVSGKDYNNAAQDVGALLKERAQDKKQTRHT